jgi:zinc/manganese transport system substrate-binding protein
VRSLLLIPVLLLTGCAAPVADDGLVHIVASTNVYGDIAEQLGGDLVDVTSIIDDPSQDPHSFEGTARIQLALSKADIVIENGGGYDDWADQLLAGAGNDDAEVVNAVDLSDYDTAAGFNEHVWYDVPTMKKLVTELVARLSAAAPESATVFAANGDSFTRGLDELAAREVAISADADGVGVAITEPVPMYMLSAIGLVNVTPADFSEAIEEGTDVPPAALADTLALVGDGSAALLVYNEQTTGPATEQVLAAANKAGTPVVPVTETKPANLDYLAWMNANLDALAAALG